MTILCYHAVQQRWNHPLATEPDAFAWQSAWLRRHRTVLPLRDALPRLDATGRLPRGEVALTFDDGFADMHSEAWPVLTRERLPATMFLVAQTLTPAGQAVDWIRTPVSEPLRTLTIDQVLEMQDAGIDFQSHSWAHRDLVDLTMEECVRDLRDSRELLSEVLGRPVTLLAYPRGLHNEQVRKAAERAGYSHAFTLPEGPEEPGPYAVPRVGIYRGNGRLTVGMKAARPYLRLRTSAGAASAARRAKRVLGGMRPAPR
jgi:peptidoglycan/xylan/chitin deacetylase (PgdA/CDA1 family)